MFSEEYSSRKLHRIYVQPCVNNNLKHQDSGHFLAMVNLKKSDLAAVGKSWRLTGYRPVKSDLHASNVS
eukprot:scaffold24136_cov157-Cylindrotheca_fusiformis.AAC.2